ncbi:MAG: cysteine hydrolase family protein [Haloferacaceae archaeon]
MLADPALVLVDLQRDFCDPSGAHGRDADVSDPRSAVESAVEFLERYRASGRTPVFVRTIHDEASTSPRWAQKYADRPTPCRPGTEGAELMPALDVGDDDVVVTKHRYSGFQGTDLDQVLRSNGVSRVLVGGVATNVCVESTARAAFDHDYDVTLLRDCTGSTEPELKDASLRNVQAHFGDVRDSDAVDLPPVD